MGAAPPRKPHEKVRRFEDTHSLLYVEGMGKLGAFVNATEFYRTLRLSKLDYGSDKVLVERYNEQYPNATHPLNLDQYNHGQKLLLGLIIEGAGAYDAVYGRETKTIKDGEVWLHGYDGYANISISGATFATLHIGKEVELKLERDGGVFTFRDITLDNPLFPSVGGAQLWIETDGTTVTMDVIVIDIGAQYHGLTGFSAITYFPSLNKAIFAGHMWSNATALVNLDRIRDSHVVRSAVKGEDRMHAGELLNAILLS